MVVIAASGVAESGRILHHLKYGASDPQVGIDAVHRKSPGVGDVWLGHGEPQAQDALSVSLTASG